MLFWRKLTMIGVVCATVCAPTGTATVHAGEEKRPKKLPLKAPARKESVLEAELEVPDTFTISAKQIAEIAELRKEKASIPTLQKKISYLSKNAEANRDEIEKLRKKIRGVLGREFNMLRSMKQGISIKLILRNTGTSDMAFRYGGDSSTVDIVVTGPGAWNLPYRGPFTLRPIAGKPVTIKAGSSYTLVLNEFKYGKREYSRWLIDKPGEYTVAVAYNGVIVADRRYLKGGGKSFRVKAKPVTFKVVKKHAVNVRWSGRWCRNSERENIVVSDQETWKVVWKDKVKGMKWHRRKQVPPPPAPEVDFTKSRLACTFYGFAGVGEKIEVTGVTEAENEIVVRVRCYDSLPADVPRIGIGFNGPHCVVDVPAGKKPVRFEADNSKPTE